jgi:hypothetical protein
MVEYIHLINIICFNDLNLLLEPISKMSLTPNSCVTDLLKMLTYYRVCCAFSSAGALLFDVIHYF